MHINPKPIIAAVLTALVVAAIADAQSVGLGIKKDATLAGTGSSGSPLGLAPCVTSGHTWVWNGTAFACNTAGGASFSTANTVPKGNGTGLAASLITDDTSMLCYNGCSFEADADGTTWTADIHSVNGFFNGGISVSGVSGFSSALDVQGDLTIGSGPTKFTVQASTGNITTLGNSILGNSDSDSTSLFGGVDQYDDNGTATTGAGGVHLYDTTAVGANIGPRIAFGSKGASASSTYYDMAAIKAVKESASDPNYDTALVFATTSNASGAYPGAPVPAEQMRITGTGVLQLAGNDIRLTSSTGVRWTSGSGTPESAVTAPVGSIFSRTNGGAGTSVYIKESGTGNTGWVGISSGGGLTNSAGANVITKSNGTNLVASSVTDDGTTWAINTNKVTVTEASGNTSIAGTLGVTGLITATAGGTTAANWTTTGTGDLVSADDLTVADDATISDALVVAGTSDLRGAVSNSTGTLTLSDDIDLGASTSSALSFTNSAKGAVLNYSGKHLEWSEEFMNTPTTSQMQGIWGPFTGASGSISAGSSAGGRPGLVTHTTSTSATAISGYLTASTAIDLDDGVWNFRWIGNFPTLSTSSERYRGLTGFSDNFTSAGQSNACIAAYDEGNTLTGGANASNANKWGLCSASGGSRTCVILDGTTQGGITTVDSPVVAATYYNVLVSATTASCSVAIDGTTRATITTNVPTSVLGNSWGLIKTVGTTARTMNVDHVDLAVDLTSAR